MQNSDTELNAVGQCDQIDEAVALATTSALSKLGPNTDQHSENELQEVENEENDDDDENEEFYDDFFELSDTLNEPSTESAASDTTASGDTNNSGTTGLQKLLNKQRVELAMELRRLQFRDRPVTGQEIKTRLAAAFLNSGLQQQQQQQHDVETMNAAGASTNSATVDTDIISASNTSNVYRPAILRDEIAELSEQRRVSQLLSSSTRALIENSINALLQRRDGAGGGVGSHANDAITQVPLAREDNRSWPSQPPSQLRPTIATNRQLTPSIDAMAREQIIYEISELVQGHVVTNTLRSSFRHELERRVLDALRRRSSPRHTTNAATAPEQQPQQQTDSDAAASDDRDNSQAGYAFLGSNGLRRAHRRPAVRHNARFGANTGAGEIQELKAEMSELKSLLKLSFELQMDMQRALKQEIAALIAASAANMQQHGGLMASTSAAALATTSSIAASEGRCLICVDSHADTVLYQCGHLCACFACSMNLKQQGHACPVCRAPIKDIMRVYKTSVE